MKEINEMEFWKQCKEYAAYHDGYVDIGEIAKALEKTVKEVNEVSIETPAGKLLCGVETTDTGYQQTYVGFESEETGMIDLFMAEYREGDINTYTWDNVMDEDFTEYNVITKEEIQALKDEYSKEEEREI